MTAVDIELDWELLAGEMEQQPCEHSQHGTLSTHSGPATHYVRTNCSCEHDTHTLYAACQRFVNFIISGQMGHCSDCGENKPLNEILTVLAPIN